MNIYRLKKGISFGIAFHFILLGICFFPSEIHTVRADIDTGLTGYWSFNEGSGNTAYDGSGNGNDGTIIGATWSEGIYGGALYFDGDNDYVDFNSPVLNNPPYSICAWVKPDSITGGTNMYVIANGGEGGGSGFYINTEWSGDYNGDYRYGISEKDTCFRGSTSTDPPSTNWTFLCGTWDGTKNPDNIKLYVNGEMKATGIKVPYKYSPKRNLRIGAPSNDENIYFFPWIGLIDEVRIFNRALTVIEIQDLYNLPDNTPPNKPGTPSGPISGLIRTSYIYTANKTDPDGDNLTYMFFWGDGSNSGWIGPYESGEVASASHSWKLKGSYIVKVRAKDIHNAEGPLSDPFGPVKMPKGKDKEIQSKLLKFTEHMPQNRLDLPSLLRLLLIILEFR